MLAKIKIYNQKKSGKCMVKGENEWGGVWRKCYNHEMSNVENGEELAKIILNSENIVLAGSFRVNSYREMIFQRINKPLDLLNF